MLTCMHAYRYSYKDKYAFLPLLKEKKKKKKGTDWAKGYWFPTLTARAYDSVKFGT